MQASLGDAPVIPLTEVGVVARHLLAILEDDLEVVSAVAIAIVELQGTAGGIRRNHVAAELVLAPGIAVDVGSEEPHHRIRRVVDNLEFAIEAIVRTVVDAPALLLAHVVVEPLRDGTVCAHRLQVEVAMAGAVIEVDKNATVWRNDIAADNVLFPAVAVHVGGVEGLHWIRRVVDEVDAPIMTIACGGIRRRRVGAADDEKARNEHQCRDRCSHCLLPSMGL